MFNCEHCDQYGDCRKYSSLNVAVPCPRNSGCEDYVEVGEDGK